MQSDKQSVIERIKKIVATQLDVDIPIDQIGNEDGFLSAIGVDSIGFIELRYQCEAEFDIKVKDEEFTPKNFLNCETLSAFILGKKETSKI